MENKKNTKQNSSKKHRRKLRPVGVAILIGGAYLLAVLLFATISVTQMYFAAQNFKNSYLTAIEALQGQDAEVAKEALEKTDSLRQVVRENLSAPFWKLISKIPAVSEKMDSAVDLLDLTERVNDALLEPVVDQMVAYPISELKVDDGFNVITINAWLDFAETLVPEIQTLVDEIPNYDTSLVGSQEEVNGYIEKINEVSNKYNDLKQYLPVLRTFLNSTSNRSYLVVALNAAEIRALGGFPGACGLVTIRDGVLKIGDFSTVGYYISEQMPDTVSISAEESILWTGNGMITVGMPRDAEIIPDFSRCAEIFAAGFESMNGYQVDGIVAMTPTIIQKVLSFCGEITLSDGTVVNGSNATKVLEYDIYMKYFTSDTDPITEGNSASDTLFSETAKQTMHAFMENFSFSNIGNYADMFIDSMNERTLFMWMKDEAEEQVIIDTGCSGVLTKGVPNSVTGAYFTLSVSSKLGWWVDFDAEADEGFENWDGSHTYNVTVTLNNTMTYEEYSSVNWYVHGGNGGVISGYVDLFAPTGGYISNLWCYGYSFSSMYYEGVQVYYCNNINIYQDTPITIHYQVTVPAGVDTPLTIAKTPTLTQYRQ